MAKEKRKMKQGLGNPDAGIGAFRERAFTQRGNECLVEITKIGHCTKKRFCQKSIYAHVERIPETGVKTEERKRHWLFRSHEI